MEKGALLYSDMDQRLHPYSIRGKAVDGKNLAAILNGYSSKSHHSAMLLSLFLSTSLRSVLEQAASRLQNAMAAGMTTVVPFAHTASTKDLACLS